MQKIREKESNDQSDSSEIFLAKTVLNSIPENLGHHLIVELNELSKELEVMHELEPEKAILKKIKKQ
jgi:DsbC/DsbD-like thiol-disulfide interchange protein